MLIIDSKEQLGIMDIFFFGVKSGDGNMWRSAERWPKDITHQLIFHDSFGSQFKIPQHPKFNLL